MMNTKRYRLNSASLSLAVLAAALTSSAAFAQEDARLVVTPPDRTAVLAINDDVVKNQPIAKKEGLHIRKRAEPVVVAAADVTGSESELLTEVWHAAPGLYEVQMGNLIGAGAPQDRALIVPSSAPDSKTMSEIAEDMTVMARILSKALKATGLEDEVHTAMGMKLQTLGWRSPSPSQNLYLEGFGALFLLQAQFPMLAPPAEETEETELETAHSLWEETKRELYGRSQPSRTVRFWRSGSAKTASGFDEKKVEKLKDSLVESLKNATNIRHVKPEEFIQLVVEGSPQRSPSSVLHFSHADKRISPPRIEVLERNVEHAIDGEKRASVFRVDRSGMPGDRPTTMAIRAKKSDVDAFAKGTLSLPQFRGKVSILTF